MTTTSPTIQTAAEVRKHLRARGVTVFLATRVTPSKFSLINISKREALDLLAGLDSDAPVFARTSAVDNCFYLGQMEF